MSDLQEWHDRIDPRPGWVREVSRHDPSGWTVTGRWAGTADQSLSQGPLELRLVLRPDAAADVVRRGVTTGVLRRMETYLAEMGAAALERPTGTTYELMARRYVEGRLAELPAGPREGADYYAGFLALFEEVRDKGHAAPLKLLADVAGLPEGTVKTRLRTARLRRSATVDD